MMTATNPRDRELVRNLLREHLPSGFPQALSPLTIGCVACRILNDWQCGRVDLFVWEKPIIDRLLRSTVALPSVLSDETVTGALTEAMGEAPTLSFVGLFRPAIDALILERGRNLVLPHPRAF